MASLQNVMALVLIFVALLGLQPTSGTEKAQADRRARLEELRKTMDTMKSLFNEQFDAFEQQLQPPEQKKSAKDFTELWKWFE